MPEPPLHILDEPYKEIAVFLEVIRDHIHTEIVRKHTNLIRSDYQIFWRFDGPDAGWEIKAERGKRILILFNCNPTDGARSIMYARRVVVFPNLRHLKQGTDIILRKDAARLYGFELDKVDVSLYEKKNKLSRQHHTITTESIYIVTLVDNETKKKVSVTVRNSNKFTAEELAWRELYGED